MKQSKRKRDNAVPVTAEQPIADMNDAASALIDATDTGGSPDVLSEAVAMDVTAAEPNPKEHTVSDAESTKSSAASQAHMYALNAHCTVRDGVQLKSALLDLLGDPHPVTIDVRAVERIDTAALQLLCAFVRDRRAAGGAVNWIGGAESFGEAVRLLGLADVLGISRDLLQGADA